MTGKIKNAIVATLQAINSGTVHERIDAEQKRLEVEALREKQLEADRLPLLESGDDAALDKVEAAINESRTAQLRTQERIELLTKRLSEREQLEQQGKFDELRERADRLREFGEQLIREQYAKAASELAKVLHKLRAVDELIEETNYALARAGRATVGHTNAIRCTRSHTEQVTRKRRVGLGDSAHPYYGRAQFPFNRMSDTPGEEWNPEVLADNGERTRCFVDIDEVVQVHHTADIQDVLHTAIEVLPSATTSTVPLYSSGARTDQQLLDALRAEFQV